MLSAARAHAHESACRKRGQLKDFSSVYVRLFITLIYENLICIENRWPRWVDHCGVALFSMRDSPLLTKLRMWLKHFERRRRGECEFCGRTLILSSLDTSGSNENISIYFQGLPCLSCGDPTHPKRYATLEFGSKLMGVLYFAGENNFPASRLKRFGDRWYCYSCGKGIAGSVRPGQISGVVKITGTLGFNLKIAGPIVTCEFCRSEQLYNTKDVSFRTNEAIVEAFKKISLKPR
ncbi:MAG: hypothetical protein RL768_2853 [Nitrospirota bacterium]